jgi:hypothetical protein
MKESAEPIAFLKSLKQTFFSSGKRTERILRRAIKQMSPGALIHRLRWSTHSREYLSQWTANRLQLDGYYWLFILGLNNSGTTLLAELLQSHPAMRWLPNEGQYLTGALPLPRDHDVPRNFSQRLDVFHWTEANDSAPALRVQYDWSRFFQQRPGILLEKSPPNTTRSRWLQANISPSRFVSIIRHPYAVCEGIRRREGASLEDAAQHWVIANETMLADMEHLHHCVCVSYEGLCAEPLEHLDKLQEFLGLDVPFDSKIVTKPRKIHNIGDATMTIHNFNARSVENLSLEDRRIIDHIAGPLMERLGYERHVDMRNSQLLQHQ